MVLPWKDQHIFAGNRVPLRCGQGAEPRQWEERICNDEMGAKATTMNSTSMLRLLIQHFHLHIVVLHHSFLCG